MAAGCLMVASVVLLLGTVAADDPGTYQYWYNTSSGPCIRLQAAIEAQFVFNTSPTAVSITTVMFNGTNTTSGSGNQSSPTSEITITWFTDYSLTFQFNSSKNKKEWSLNNVTFEFSVSGNPKFKDYVNYTNASTLSGVASSGSLGTSVPYGQCSKCTAGVNLTFPLDSTFFKTMGASVMITDWKAQAFSFKDNTGTFGKTNSCSADKKGSIVVPIAVGAALAGLVIVVVVVWIIGKIRDKFKRPAGYEDLN